MALFWRSPTPADFEEEELPAHQLQIFTALREENKALANQTASYLYQSRGRKNQAEKNP